MHFNYPISKKNSMKKLTQLLPISILSLVLIVGCNKSTVTNITLPKEAVTLSIGEEYKIIPNITTKGKEPKSPIKYTSYNNEVATVSQEGVVRGKKLGKTTIEVSIDKKSAYCQVTVTQSDIIMTTATTNYWGDLYRNKTNAFDFYGLEKGVSIASNGNIVGSGTFLYLDFITPDDHYALQSGTYHATLEDQTYTFVKGFVEKDHENKEIIKGSYLGVVAAQGGVQKTLIIDGLIEIEMTNNYYTISGYVVSEKQTKHQVSYKGEIPMVDFVTPMPQELSQGAIEYWGDTDKYGKATLFMVKLGDKGTDMDKFSGGNDKMALEVGVPIGTSMFGIPDGTYPVQNTNIVQPQYLVGGYKDQQKNNYGCWYYTGDEFLLNKGTVTFAKKGTVSTITYRLEDQYFGHNINGTWIGELKYSNHSNAQNIAKRATRWLVKRDQQTADENIVNVKTRKRVSR